MVPHATLQFTLPHSKPQNTPCAFEVFVRFWIIMAFDGFGNYFHFHKIHSKGFGNI